MAMRSQNAGHTSVTMTCDLNSTEFPMACCELQCIHAQLENL